MVTASPLFAALVLAAFAPVQDGDAYRRAIERCDTAYVKRTTACRRAVGNYRCLQDVLDRLSACRQQAQRLQPPAPAAMRPPVAGTVVPAR